VLLSFFLGWFILQQSDELVLASFIVCCLELLLWQAINGWTGLLHSPALDSSVLSCLDDFWDRPDVSALSHVESTHWLLVGGELVGVEDTSGAYEARVSVLLEPLGADLGSWSVQDALVGGTGLLDGTQLLGLAGLVVGGGGEAEGLPDVGDLWRAKVGLADEREVDGDSWKVVHAPDLVGLLLGAVQAVAESVLVQALLKADFGNAFLAAPEIVEAQGGALEEAEIFHLHGGLGSSRLDRSTNGLLSQRSQGGSRWQLVGSGTRGDGEEDGGGGELHG